MLAHGDIDAMVTGLSRNYLVAYDNIRLAIDGQVLKPPVYP